jgi:6-phosphogluconolactonase/glucosamine-6-phosphate isomerase/deaminase
MSGPGVFPVPGHAANIEQACKEYEARCPNIRTCALGYGENGHLAFNDPPFADFDDPVCQDRQAGRPSTGSRWEKAAEPGRSALTP